ncbi:MAG TPA: hypothetical protein VJH71_01930 [Candidatus Paceibacterota bacterium]
MTIKDLDLNKLQTEIKERETKIEQTATVLENLRSQLRILKQQIQEQEEQSGRLVSQKSLLERMVILKIGVKIELIDARSSHLLIMQEYVSEQITVAHQRELRQQLEKSLAALQSSCNHTFLFSWAGYRGSYSLDHDDAYHGSRLCVVCGKKEDEERIGSNDYKTLTGENSLVGYPNEHTTDQVEKLIWRPLGEVLEMYLDQRVFKLTQN